MKNYILTCLFLIVIIRGVMIDSSTADAEDLNFTVTPIIPDNQIGETTTYFDLRMFPGQEQHLEVELLNTSDHEITVLMYTTTAVTNLHGVIEYKDIDPVIDNSLQYPFQDIAEISESITLAPGETKRETVEVKMPEESYVGMILGGLYFKEKENKEQESQTSSSMGVRNVFSYVMAVKLTESDELIEPDLILLDAQGGQVNYRNNFEAQLQNPQAVEMNNLTVTAQVVREGSTKVLYEQTREGMRMAPNSNFFYPIPLNDAAFQSGKYEMLVTAHTPEQEWSLKTPFEITADQATELNEESVEDLVYAPRYWLWISLGIVIIIVAVGVSIFLSNRKVRILKKQLDKQVS